MPQEHGFRFKIEGEVFIPQKSKTGTDIVTAYEEAVEARRKLSEALADIPVTFTIGDPIMASRRVKEPEGQPDAKEG